MPGASEQLRLISLHLKEMGDRENLNALRRGFREAAKPLTVAVKDAARTKLPKGGGLNEQVAGQRVSVSTRTGARTSGVRLTTTAPDTDQTDAGYVRKPVWGNRKVWVTQQIPAAAGWWSQTLAHSAPAVTPELVVQLEAAAARLGLR